MKRILTLMLTAMLLLNLLPPIEAKAAMQIQIGEYVQMGTYYNEPILWRCVDIDENGPLMLSDKIICIKPFDASGTNTAGSHGRGYYENGTQGYYRQRRGSNYWADSNIRCWLNSTASAGNVEWLCGNPPDEAHVSGGYNEYADEAGFLTNFTKSELVAMQSVAQKSLLDGYEYSVGSLNTFDSNYHKYNKDIADVVQNYDTASSETVTDRMFLLDVKQIHEVYANEGILGVDYYIGEPTVGCIGNSEYPNSILVNKKWFTLLRSPNVVNTPSLVRCITSEGDVSNAYPYGGTGGVRPAFYLNLSSASISSGTGTNTDPYTVAGGSKQNHNKREDKAKNVNITIMKNRKDMTDSEDDYVEHEKLSLPKDTVVPYTLEGYESVEINTALYQDGDKVYLEKSGMKVPEIGSVFLDGVDVRLFEKKIKSDFTGQLSAHIDWNGQKEKIAYIDNGITQLKLTDGKTEPGVNWGNFVQNARDIEIVAKTVNGYTTKKKLYISMDAIEPPENIDFNMCDAITGLGSGLVPYLDDLSLSFDIPNFKLDFAYNPDDNSIKGVFGVDVAEWAYENNLRDKKAGKWEEQDKQNAYMTITELMKDTVKEMEKNKKDQKTLAQEYKKLKKQLGKSHKKTTAKFGFDAGINVVGYAEGRMDHDGFYLSDAGVIVTVEVEGSIGGQGIIWVIPYNWKVSGKAEANLNLQLAQREIRAERLTPMGSIGITIGVSGEGGPGLEKVHLNLGVEGEFMPLWKFAPQSIFTLDASVGIYIEAVAWMWSWKEDLWKQTYHLYPREKTKSLMSINAAYDADNYSLRTRRHAHIPSEFVANDSRALTSYETQTHPDKLIKTNAYDISTPQYAPLADGRTILVWLDDDTSRTVINGTSLMYSIHDGGVWSEPLYVQDDGTADFAPQLKTVGDSVYLVWEEMDAFETEVAMEEAVKTMDIKCAKFDAENNVFTNVLQLTENEYMDITPEVGVSDSDLVVSWVTSTSGNPFAAENTYSISYAVVRDGAVTKTETAAQNIASVDSHIAVMQNGTVDVYYICDTDGVLSNVSDNVLLSAAGTTVDSEHVSGLQSFDGVVYYYKNGRLASIGESLVLNHTVSVENNHYCITNNGKTVLFTAQDGKTADIYAYFYNEAQGVWGDAVRLTDLGCKITDINGFSDADGKLYLAFNKKNIAEEGAETAYSTSDLAVLEIAPAYNITLLDVYTENSNLIPGQDAVLHIEVYNAGEQTVDAIEVTICDNEGNVLSVSETEAALLPGMTGEYDITYMLSEDFVPSDIQVTVLPKGEEDYNRKDNTMSLHMDFNNLAITGINATATESGYQINAVITNTGFSEEKDIEVALFKDDTIEQTVVIAALPVLEKTDVSFANVSAGAEYIVRITEKDNEDILVDNEEKIVVQATRKNTDTDGYMKELSYEDGAVKAEISMFNSFEASHAYIAIYDASGRLVGFHSEKIAVGDKSVPVEWKTTLSDTQSYTAKLMLWNDANQPFMIGDTRELVTAKTITVDTVLESEHNYANNTDKTYSYTYEGTCQSIDVTFTAETKTESNWDYIYIYDAEDNQIGKYSGTQLSGGTVNVPGNTVKLRLTSDSSNTYYGFKTQSIIVNR